MLVLSKSCAIIVFGIQFGLIQCYPEWIGIGVCKYLTGYYFLRVHVSYHVLLACHFIVCLDSSGKGWQLTCVQHTRRLTRVQHMKYYSRASYNRAAHKDGPRAAHEIELACSTQKITLVSHASSVRVTRQKYKNTRVLPHVSVNLEMSCTVAT